jgi:hypothetical protein
VGDQPSAGLEPEWELPRPSLRVRHHRPTAASITRDGGKGAGQRMNLIKAAAMIIATRMMTMYSIVLTVKRPCPSSCEQQASLAYEAEAAPSN